MYTQLVRSDGSYFPLPVQSCEYADGSEACLLCVANVQNDLFEAYMKSLHSSDSDP